MVAPTVSCRSEPPARQSRALAAEEIPLVARIVACCDADNAMTTDRSYRKALSQDEAVAELRRSSGTQFHPDVVEALVAVAERA